MAAAEDGEGTNRPVREASKRTSSGWPAFRSSARISSAVHASVGVRKSNAAKSMSLLSNSSANSSAIFAGSKKACSRLGARFSVPPFRPQSTRWRVNGRDRSSMPYRCRTMAA